MTSKQIETNVKQTDGKCDKCAKYRLRAYINCPKCGEELRIDPAKIITDILTTSAKPFLHDDCYMLTNSIFDLPSTTWTLLRKHFPDEIFMIKSHISYNNLPLKNGKITIEYTLREYLKKFFPALYESYWQITQRLHCPIIVINSDDHIADEGLIYKRAVKFTYPDSTGKVGVYQLQSVFKPEWQTFVSVISRMELMTKETRSRVWNALFPKV